MENGPLKGEIHACTKEKYMPEEKGSSLFVKKKPGRNRRVE